MSNKNYSKLPKLALNLLLLNQGWLVGSSVLWYMSDEYIKTPRDFDIIIPPSKWSDATKLIDTKTLTINLNKFGGLKIIGVWKNNTDKYSIDLWPSHLEDYFNPIGFTGKKLALRLNPFCYISQLM